MSRLLQVDVPWAGLAAGAAAWAISTQAGYSLASMSCGGSRAPTLAIVIGSLMLAGAGGVLSWQAWRCRGGPTANDDARSAHPHRLMAGLGVLAAALFALGIVLQAMGVLIISGCDR
jgi:hypothetical protein